MKSLKTLSIVLMSGLFAFGALSAQAYDGTKCRAKGNCWEAKPGYPDKIAGSKFDPKHSKTELEKQPAALKAMDDRNAAKSAEFKKTGKWPS